MSKITLIASDPRGYRITINTPIATIHDCLAVRDGHGGWRIQGPGKYIHGRGFVRSIDLDCVFACTIGRELDRMLALKTAEVA